MTRVPPPVKRSYADQPNRFRNYLLPEEMDLIIDAARKRKMGLRDRLLLETMYRHGLTPAQARHLRWEDIDLYWRKLTIWRAPKEFGTHLLEDQEIKDFRWWKAKQRLRKYGGESLFVFSGRHGTSMSPRALHRILEECATAAGITIPVRPMMIRHSKGYELMANNVDVMEASAFLGNKSLDTTVKYAPPITVEDLRGFSAFDSRERRRELGFRN